MRFAKLILALACLMPGTLAAQEAKVTELMSKDLTTLSGNKEGLMVTVEYPPGSSDPIHRQASVIGLASTVNMKSPNGFEVGQSHVVQVSRGVLHLESVP